MNELFKRMGLILEFNQVYIQLQPIIIYRPYDVPQPVYPGSITPYFNSKPIWKYITLFGDQYNKYLANQQTLMQSQYQQQMYTSQRSGTLIIGSGIIGGVQNQQSYYGQMQAQQPTYQLPVQQSITQYGDNHNPVIEDKALFVKVKSKLINAYNNCTTWLKG